MHVPVHEHPQSLWVAVDETLLVGRIDEARRLDRELGSLAVGPSAAVLKGLADRRLCDHQQGEEDEHGHLCDRLQQLPWSGDRVADEQHRVFSFTSEAERERGGGQ